MSDVVFIHGARQGSWAWRETIAALSASGTYKGKLLALDVPGCGNKSNNKKKAFHVADIVSELADEVVRAGIQNAVIVSHSQGGTLVPQLVTQVGQCFSAALFTSAVIPLEGKTVAETMGSDIHGASADHVGWPQPLNTTAQDSLLRAMFYDPIMKEETLQALLERAQIDAWPSHSVYSDNFWGWDQLAAINTAYLIAKHDHTIPEQWQEKFANRIGPHTQKFYLDGGHQIIQTQPHAVAAIIRQIIAQ